MMDALSLWLTGLLQPIADWFSGFNTPELVIRWGHPLMMGIVVFVMGSTLAFYGWRIRMTADVSEKAKAIKLHKRTGPFLILFISLGFSGGLLSLLMQHKQILHSPHFWTGSLAIALLVANGAISFSKFGGGKPELRTLHAYLGSGAIALLFVHALLGLNLGLSIG
jgi:phosphoglycerol transferase MdoB-like AlkP superfamily enzyme